MLFSVNAKAYLRTKDDMINILKFFFKFFSCWTQPQGRYWLTSIHSFIHDRSKIRSFIYSFTCPWMLIDIWNTFFYVFFCASQCPYICHLLYLLTRKESGKLQHVSFFTLWAVIFFLQHCLDFVLSLQCEFFEFANCWNFKPNW